MPDTDAQKENKENKRLYQARIADYLKTFTSAHGRRVLKDMRKSYCGHIFSDIPENMALGIGKREVVKDIEAMLISGKNPQAIEDLFRMPEDDGFEL